MKLFRWFCVFVSVFLFIFPMYGDQSGSTSFTPNVRPSQGQTYCPVLTDLPPLHEHAALYKGRTVRFCCADCKRAFLQNPERYAVNLPDLSHLDAADPEVSGQEGDDEEIAAAISDLVVNGGLFLLVLIAAGMVLWWPRGSLATPRSFRPVRVIGFLALALAIPLGYFVYQLRAQVSGFEEAKIDAIHFATFDDYGLPPRPAHPPVGKRLGAAFYRGNDERHPKLFNGGNYRTTTFDLSLSTADGTRISYDDNLTGKEVFVRIEVERAPNTADFFFEDQIMRMIFLTREFGYFLARDEPVQDAVELRTLEEMQRWEALYPLGVIAGRDAGEVSGVVYVCQKLILDLEIYGPLERLLTGHSPFSAGGQEMIGSRFHYAIQYDLRLEDGVVTPESDLWMGSLYRTHKVDLAQLPHTEWFSHEPIPTLPSRQAYDPELLGIEYEGEKLLGVRRVDQE